MNETPAIDTFNLCWNAVLKESELFNFSIFNEGHCKITDSRDTDFTKVENRLAYAYKFGYFNVHYVEKCISNFFTEYSGPESVFPLENLKICSLSNGPGLDIVGLLCALYKFKKVSKCFPHLKAINLYDSWLPMYKAIVRTAYESICLKSNVEYFHIPFENIHLIQSDIYNTISPEAEKVISDSNVLLMVKIFVSTKATINIFTHTLKKIFSLLKPGTLIFFVGPKTNIQKFSQDASLSCPVKCIYGPQKVTLKDLLLKEDIVNNLAVKPQNSGHAYFIVWQKQEVDAPLEVIKVKKKRARRKKKKVLATVQNQKDCDNIVSSSNSSNIDELLDDIDVGSETSFTSCSKQSDSLSDELKDDLFTASDEIQNLKSVDYINSAGCSVDSVISALDLGDSNNIEVQPSNHESINDGGLSNLENHNQEKKIEVGNLHQTQSLADVCSKEASTEQIKNAVTIQNEISDNVLSQSVKESVSATKVHLDHLNTEKSTTDGFYQTMFPQVTQNKVSKEPNTPSKKTSKNKKPAKAFLSDVNAEIRNDMSMPETTLQDKLSVNQPPENIFKFPRSVMGTQNSNDRNCNDVQKLIQRCENLITSLEKMTADMKKDISSRSGQCFIKKCCCTSESHSDFRAPISCCAAVLHMQSYSCRTTCNCRILKNICTSCSNSLPCGSNVRETHACCINTRYVNLHKPCIVIPLQHDHF